MNKLYLKENIPLIEKVFVFLAILSLLSCSQEETTYDSIEYEKFNSVLYTRKITVRELIDSAIDYFGPDDELLEPYKKEIAMLKSLNIVYNVHAITYHTVTPKGEPDIASGVVYFPQSFHPLGVIEVSPFNKNKRNCGSELCLLPEVVPGMVGYICIVPDLIGCGASDDLPISYLQHENTAVVSADMRKAAEEFIYNYYHYQLPRESLLYGYSLGGSCAVSLARYYEKHPSRGVRVKHLFAGGGAYDPELVVESQLEDNRSDYAVIPNILYSMNYYDDLHLDFSKIFKGDLLINYEKWCDGYLPITELTHKLGTNIRDYFNDDFLACYRTDTEYKPLIEAIRRKKIPEDWTPNCKVTLYHAIHDYYVPKVGADRLNLYLNSVNADVRYVECDDTHEGAFLVMTIDFAKYLLAKQRE